MTELADLRKAIEQHGLAEHADRILRLAKPSIRITPKRAADGSRLALNRSMFAGPVGLAPGQEWPMVEDRAMMRLAQIRLSDVAPFDRSGLLPKQGYLSFWVDIDDTPWGFDPKHRDGFRVVYIPDEGTKLIPSHPPAKYGNDGFEWIATCKLDFRDEWTIPHFKEHDLPDFERNGLANLTGYQELVEELDPFSAPTHRLLGHPKVMQGSMEEGVQLVTNGVYCGGATVDPVRRKELAGGIDDWMLLLQIDTDEENPGWMWGDTGSIYFWIRKQDLAIHDFSKSWLALQCF